MGRAAVSLVPLLLLQAIAGASGTIRLSRGAGNHHRRRPIVGGWSNVPDVAANEEVQEIGRFSVEEHNRRAGGEGTVTFREVIEARRQVVSGIKYRLRIAAVDDVRGEDREFMAVVVVKPWLPSRRLLSFVPAAEPAAPRRR